MLVFPNCKINLGLHVTSKRPDGFHNIETVFYPVNWCDALEVIENKSATAAPFTFSHSGLAIQGTLEQNLIYKAWKLITQNKKLPSLKVHLHKNIPMGAGLGGGSSDAAYFINLVNTQFFLNYSDDEKTGLASLLGSDCAFFIKNHPVFAVGKGNEFSEVAVNLSNYYILLVYPKIHSNTKEAYESLQPKSASVQVLEILNTPLETWKTRLTNDFEPALFEKYPEIKQVKDAIYAAGAVYASMSGSGSAVFGIFEKEPAVSFPAHYLSHIQKPVSKIL